MTNLLKLKRKGSIISSGGKDFSHLYNQIATTYRYYPSYRRCVIQSLAPQGSLLFAIARYEDEIVTQVDDTQKTVPGTYVGNEIGLEEDDLLLAEILIPTDILLDQCPNLDIKTFIGQVVRVELINNQPKVIFLSESIKNARIIPREEFQAARATNEFNDIRLPSAQNLLSVNGYSSSDYQKMLQEKVKDIKPDGRILIYADIADYCRLSAEDKDDYYKNLSQWTHPSIVTGLPTSKIKDRVCFSPPRVFSGY